MKFRPVLPATGGLFLKNSFAAGLAQRLNLRSGVLIVGL
jgi:hypothetical protein